MFWWSSLRSDSSVQLLPFTMLLSHLCSRRLASSFVNYRFWAKRLAMFWSDNAPLSGLWFLRVKARKVMGQIWSDDVRCISRKELFHSTFAVFLYLMPFARLPEGTLACSVQVISTVWRLALISLLQKISNFIEYLGLSHDRKFLSWNFLRSAARLCTWQAKSMKPSWNLISVKIESKPGW